MPCRSSALLTSLLTTLAVPAALVAQSQPALADLGRCSLESGAMIEDCRLSYATAGELNADRSNAVVIVPWFSGTTQASLSLIGSGKLVDSSKYYVVAVGAFGDGVSSSPSTSRSQASRAFPRYTIRDMVAAQHRLVTEILDLDSLHAVVGISMGGMEVFQWMASYPGFAAKAVPIVGSPQVNGYDLLRWQTELELIEAFGECGCAGAGRLIALWEAMVAQTPDRIASQVTPETFASFSAGIGERTFDPADRASQIRAMMTHDIAAGDEGPGDNSAESNAGDWLIVAAEGDLSVSPAPALEFARRIGAKTLVLSGGCGHLSFWCEAETLAAQVDAFLASRSYDEVSSITSSALRQASTLTETISPGGPTMPTDRQIDYVEFPAADLPAAKAFYSAVFGWRFQEYGSEYSSFSDGRLDGGFYQSPAKASVAKGSALVVLYADDLESTERRVTENGGTIVRDIFPFPGGRRFHFVDPNGNELAVWSER